MTTQPSDWAVAKALELSMQSVNGCSVRAHDWIMKRARELDASGGGGPLAADCQRSLPGGSLDDSTFQAVEDALDKVLAPAQQDGRWLTLPERIAALATPQAAEAGDAIRALPAKWRGEQIDVPPAPHGSSAKSYNCALAACADELEAAIDSAMAAVAGD